ncbi:MAG TPA: tetratricopeptide repeat protein [Candidatus Saccharimonadales bacterium]|nr:tetratricopeptide repeat protein [Candidatus Saccharimonadales bacterium]
MSDSEQAGIHPLLKAAALLAVFVMIALLAGRQAGSLEIGLNLRAGLHILSGAWPASDTFTYSLREGPYVDTTWLYQVLVAASERVGGAAGVVLFHAAFILATFLLLYLTAREGSADSLVLAGLLLLGALASELRFEARPEILSAFLLALTLLVLHRYAARRESAGASPTPAAGRKLLYLLPVLQILWVNTHGLFILGWVAMACFSLGLWIRDRALDYRLAGWSAGAAFATLLNPYGWKGVLAPLSPAGARVIFNAFGQSIDELASPFSLHLAGSFPFYPRTAIFSFRLFALLSLLALPGLLRRRRYAAALLWLPFFALSIRTIENIPFTVIACLPWMAWSLDSRRILSGAARLAQRSLEPRRLRAILAAATALVAIFALVMSLRVASDAHYIASRRLTRTGLGWNRLALPVDATDYVRRAGFAKETVLNDVSFGGWLTYALDSQVYIDGRPDGIDGKFYDDYQSILDTEQAMEAAVERHSIRWLIFPYTANPRLVMGLTDDPRWRLAYLDQIAAVFVRYRPEAEAWMDPKLKTFADFQKTAPPPGSLPGMGGGPRPGPIARWIDGVWRRQRYPTYDLNVGLFHYFRNEFGGAAGRFAAAVQESGGAYYEIYNNLGAVLLRLGRYDLARKALEVVLRADPDNRIARQRMSDLDQREIR